MYYTIVPTTYWSYLFSFLIATFSAEKSGRSSGFSDQQLVIIWIISSSALFLSTRGLSKFLDWPPAVLQALPGVLLPWAWAPAVVGSTLLATVDPGMPLVPHWPLLLPLTPSTISGKREYFNCGSDIVMLYLMGPFLTKKDSIWVIFDRRLSVFNVHLPECILVNKVQGCEGPYKRLSILIIHETESRCINGPLCSLVSQQLQPKPSLYKEADRCYLYI